MDVPSINIELLRSRAADIRREVQTLQGYASLPLKEFVGSPEKVRAARYAFLGQVAAYLGFTSDTLGAV